jgi:hypothetical protein
MSFLASSGLAEFASNAYWRVPRFNFTLSPVAAEFGVDAQYAESLALCAAPWLALLAVSGVLCVPLWCARLLCCANKAPSRRSAIGCCSKASSSLGVVLCLLVCVLGVVCGYVANARLHNDVDAAVVILNDTATQIDNDLVSLNQTLFALDAGLTLQFAPQINKTIGSAHSSIQSVTAALVNVSQIEEYRLIAIHGSLVPVALSAVGGVALWKFAERSSLAWSLIAVSTWFSALGQQVSSGGHFALAVAASDLCRMADNATSDGGSISTLPAPESAAFQLVMRCSDSTELDPLLLALNASIVAFQSSLVAARAAVPVNQTLVNFLVGRITLATSAVNLVDYIAECKAATGALKRLVPVLCSGAQLNSSYVWILGTTMTLLLLSTCCVATMRSRRARAVYDRFEDEESMDEPSEATPFVPRATAAKSLDAFEGDSRNYATFASARSSTAASTRRGSQVWAN